LKQRKVERGKCGCGARDLDKVRDGPELPGGSKEEKTR